MWAFRYGDRGQAFSGRNVSPPPETSAFTLLKAEIGKWLGSWRSRVKTSCPVIISIHGVKTEKVYK